MIKQSGHQPTRVLHVITGLHVGGAEMMLLKLLQSQAKGNKYQSIVLSIQAHGELEGEVRRCCENVISLDIRAPYKALFNIPKVLQLVREFKPEVTQGWLYHGNLLSSLLKFTVNRRSTLVWNIRSSAQVRSGLSTRFVRWWCIKLSSYPAQIVYNSLRGYQYHKSIGYCTKSTSIIANGVNTEVFYPNFKMRDTFRASNGIPDDAMVVGIAGSLRTEKNYPLFFKLAVNALEKFPDTVFIAAGRGVVESNPSLTSVRFSKALRKNLMLLGEVRDMTGYMNALDVFVLTSDTEGFPNVVAEAMACGKPCVVTNAGDCKMLVEGRGEVVPIGDLNALVSSLSLLLNLSPKELNDIGDTSRKHIQDNFQMTRISQYYDDLYSSFDNAKDSSGSSE